MVGVVLVAHAPLAAALAACARHVLGEVNLACVDVEADAQPEALLQEILQHIVAQDGGEGVILLVDLVGATPFNVALRAAQAAVETGRSCEILAGVNVPMLLRILNYRARPLSELAECGAAGATHGVAVFKP
ncbi:PTS sugar transporter subunit IIA [Kerstersia similis]|uniref:PTS sugar transporter subunit IIA n=1 Tax=Kerstersia similis TaxID=206505 RepID=UPI0039EEFE50